MTSQQRDRVAPVVGLILTVAGIIAAIALSYGSLSSKVCAVESIAGRNDTRSHANELAIGRIEGKLDIILQAVRDKDGKGKP